ncbi:MAG: hypothetical protein LIO75_07735 [Lachnospiraceae bacterium]|nr:hypothetical protein [Lachnospiraceae bacterium]
MYEEMVQKLESMKELADETAEVLDGKESVGEGTTIDQLDNYDPSETDSDEVYGDPEKSMDYWEFQGDTNRCAIYSQMFIIEEMTGQELDIEEMCDIAEENGWFTEDGGTPLMDMNRLLEYYGVDSDIVFADDISAIEDCLTDGGRVVAAIDADEIWYGENDDIYIPGDGANHAVEVIGVDTSDPDAPMVILNDSGNPDGSGVMIPLDTFMDAWEDSGYMMVETV